MLQQLRVASKSWVASVIIGILVLAFALWGVADIFQGSVDNVVAVVGKTEVSALDFDQQVRSQLRALSAQSPTPITMEQARAIGLDKTVLDQVISRAALDEQAGNLGLTASQATIALQIRNNPSFRGTDGSFDPTLFLRTLQENGLTEQMFVAVTAREIAREQLLTAATDGIAAPPGFARLLYDFVNEQRIAEYLVVTPEEAGQIPQPTEMDLVEYHKSHSTQFSSPEYRAVDYVQIGPDQVAGEIEVSDADMKAQYDTRKIDYERPEQRDVEQIAYPTKEAADAAVAKIKTSAEFTAAARERGLKDEDLKLGTFAADGLDPKLSAAVFAVAEGGVTAPVQGPFGWVILRAAKIIPAENKSFEDVKEQIRLDLVKSRTGIRVTELANKLEDERGSGAMLDEAAMKIGLTVRHVAGVDRQGMTPERSQADIPMSAQFLDLVFQSEAGEESDLVRGEDDQYYIVKVTGVTAPAIRPLDSVREDVREGFVTEARNRLLQTKIDTFAEQAMKSGTLAEAGKALGHAPVTSMPLRRTDMNDVFSTQMTGQLFGTPTGTIIKGAAGQGTGLVIARVAKVIHPEPDLSSADYANFRKTAAQQLGETAVDSLAAAARKQAGVDIHQATIQRVLGDAPQ